MLETREWEKQGAWRPVESEGDHFFPQTQLAGTSEKFFEEMEMGAVWVLRFEVGREGPQFLLY